VKYTRLLSCLLYFAVAKLGPCLKIYLSAFEVSITGVLVACAIWTSITSHHITSASLFRCFGIIDIGSCFQNRDLRWAGHVARMPMSRAPRQLLTGWVSHSRSTGCPQMTWGRTLENALRIKGISKEFDEWIAIAKDRSKWRQLTHTIPKPSDAWWLKGTSRVNDCNCITQKDTQPSQTCSEGYIFLFLYATVMFLCIWGVLTRLD